MNTVDELYPWAVVQGEDGRTGLLWRRKGVESVVIWEEELDTLLRLLAGCAAAERMPPPRLVAGEDKK